MSVKKQVQSGRLLRQRAQTPGADASLSSGIAIDDGLLVQIDLPSAFGSIVRMADTMTELSAFATHLTYSGHHLIPLVHGNYIQGYHVGST
jgi:hypothetical protein